MPGIRHSNDISTDRAAALFSTTANGTMAFQKYTPNELAIFAWQAR